MSSLADLQAKKASISAAKDEAVIKAKAEVSALNEEIAVATAAEALNKAMDGLTNDERAAALKAVSK